MSDEHAGAVVVELHGVHVQAGVSVAYDHDGDAAVDLFQKKYALRHHGEHYAGCAHVHGHVEDFVLFAGGPVGREDERGDAVLLGCLLYGLYHV